MESMICEVVEQAGKLIAVCPVEHEGFIELLGDWNHWAFEYISEIPGFLLGLLVWPLVGPKISAWWRRYYHEHDECCSTPTTEQVTS